MLAESILLIVFIILALTVLLSISDQQRSHAPRISSLQTQQTSDATKQLAWMDKGKETVKAKLKDPDSASRIN